jgi:hypothetical protein
MRQQSRNLSKKTRFVVISTKEDATGEGPGAFKSEFNVETQSQYDIVETPSEKDARQFVRGGSSITA